MTSNCDSYSQTFLHLSCSTAHELNELKAAADGKAFCGQYARSTGQEALNAGWVKVVPGRARSEPIP